MQVLTTDATDEKTAGLRSILVATDGSADGHLAVAAAADIATRAGAALHIVTGYSLPPAALFAAPVYINSDDSMDPFKADALATLAQEKARAESLGASVSGTHSGRGHIFDVILTVAEELDSDLIVLGSRDLGGLMRLLSGSVSTSVLHSAHRPVLVVRGGDNAWPPSRFIVGVDRSAVSKRAARIAASIAKLYGDATMELVEVMPDPLAASSHYFSLDEELEVEHERLDTLGESLEAVAGHPIVVAAAIGEPAQVLLTRGDEQGGPNLIVVGTRGLGRVRRLVLGSVSTRMLHSGHSPLLVVPAARDSLDTTVPEPR